MCVYVCDVCTGVVAWGLEGGKQGQATCHVEIDSGFNGEEL